MVIIGHGSSKSTFGANNTIPITSAWSRDMRQVALNSIVIHMKSVCTTLSPTFRTTGPHLLKCLRLTSHPNSDIHQIPRIVGQFGTGQFSTGQFGTKQFGTKIIKTDYLAPGQFGTRTIWHRTIWQQTFDMIKFNLIEHFWQHLGQRFTFGVFVCFFGPKYG